MLDINAVHPHWKGVLSISENGNFLWHKGTNSIGTYELADGQLIAHWYDFPKEIFIDVSGHLIHSDLIQAPEQESSKIHLIGSGDRNLAQNSMNSVLSEILRTGMTKTADGSGAVEVHSAISSSEGEFLQKLVRKLDPTISIEVGLAYGISALFICDALQVRNGTQHIVIDPNQHGGAWGNSWDGIGIANVRRAGYADIVQLIEAPSYRALPELEQSGKRIDFAFIDGWHTFDFTLVDFFFIDRMLNIGGVVVFDDADWPAVRKICRFVKTNLAYSVVAVDNETVAQDTVGLGGRCVAFRKDSDDRRQWDHFVDF
jgi:predicted O-methyltransferase YrrM